MGINSAFKGLKEDKKNGRLKNTFYFQGSARKVLGFGIKEFAVEWKRTVGIENKKCV